jgi:hypothetical protein
MNGSLAWVAGRLRASMSAEALGMRTGVDVSIHQFACARLAARRVRSASNGTLARMPLVAM